MVASVIVLAVVLLVVLVVMWRLWGAIGPAVTGLATGLRVTIEAMVRPKNTVMYPIQKVDVSPRWHGLLALPIDPEIRQRQVHHLLPVRARLSRTAASTSRRRAAARIGC